VKSRAAEIPPALLAPVGPCANPSSASPRAIVQSPPPEPQSTPPATPERHFCKAINVITKFAGPAASAKVSVPPAHADARRCDLPRPEPGAVRPIPAIFAAMPAASTFRRIVEIRCQQNEFDAIRRQRCFQRLQVSPIGVPAPAAFHRNAQASCSRAVEIAPSRIRRVFHNHGIARTHKRFTDQIKRLLHPSVISKFSSLAGMPS